MGHGPAVHLRGHAREGMRGASMATLKHQIDQACTGYASYLKRTAGLTGQPAVNINGIDLDDTGVNPLREFHEGRGRVGPL